MKNLIKGLTIISFIALTACQNGFQTSSLRPTDVVHADGISVNPEFQEAVSETEESVTKMEVNVDQSLKEMDALFASIQQAILANASNSASQSGSFDFGGILGTIGSILLGGFNPLSLIMGGINLVTGLIDGFGADVPDIFGNFQGSFSQIFKDVEVIVAQAKDLVGQQRQLVVAQLAQLDPNNPAQAHLYQQLMNIMTQLDLADQKIITKVADFNTRAQTFVNQVNNMQNNNSSSGIASLAGSFLQNFQGIIGGAIQGLLSLL